MGVYSFVNLDRGSARAVHSLEYSSAKTAGSKHELRILIYTQFMHSALLHCFLTVDTILLVVITGDLLSL